MFYENCTFSKILQRVEHFFWGAKGFEIFFSFSYFPTREYLLLNSIPFIFPHIHFHAIWSVKYGYTKNVLNAKKETTNKNNHGVLYVTMLKTATQ